MLSRLKLSRTQLLSMRLLKIKKFVSSKKKLTSLERVEQLLDRMVVVVAIAHKPMLKWKQR